MLFLILFIFVCWGFFCNGFPSVTFELDMSPRTPFSSKLVVFNSLLLRKKHQNWFAPILKLLRFKEEEKQNCLKEKKIVSKTENY